MSVELLLAFCVLLCAAAIHAVTSFGFVLLTVPLLALIYDPHSAVVAAVLAGGLVTAVGWARERAHVHRPSVGWLTGSGVLGIPLGLFIFTRVEATHLLLAIGLITVVMALLMIVRIHLRDGVTTQVGAGILSGALLTTTGTNGPPIVMALAAQQLAPAVFRATMQAIFTLQALVAVAGLGFTGQVTWLTLGLVGLSIPAALLGWWWGDKIFHRLSARRMRQLVIAALMASGLSLVVSATL